MAKVFLSTLDKTSANVEMGTDRETFLWLLLSFVVFCPRCIKVRTEVENSLGRQREKAEAAIETIVHMSMFIEMSP